MSPAKLHSQEVGLNHAFELTGTTTFYPHPPMRILVMDQDSAIRQHYSDGLIRAGFRVDSAASAEVVWQALDAACYESDCYDLLITNNTLPSLSGLGMSTRPASIPHTLLFIPALEASSDSGWRLELAAMLPGPVDLEWLTGHIKAMAHVEEFCRS